MELMTKDDNTVSPEQIKADIDRPQPVGSMMNPDTLTDTWAAGSQSVDTAVAFNHALPLTVTLSHLGHLLRFSLARAYSGSNGKLLDVSSRKTWGGTSQAEAANGATRWRWGVDSLWWVFLLVYWWFKFVAVVLLFVSGVLWCVKRSGIAQCYVFYFISKLPCGFLTEA